MCKSRQWIDAVTLMTLPSLYLSGGSHENVTYCTKVRVSQKLVPFSVCLWYPVNTLMYFLSNKLFSSSRSEPPHAIHATKQPLSELLVMATFPSLLLLLGISPWHNLMELGWLVCMRFIVDVGPFVISYCVTICCLWLYYLGSQYKLRHSYTLPRNFQRNFWVTSCKIQLIATCLGVSIE